MALTKLVNGKRVTLSGAEEASVRAEWAANEARPRAPEKSRLKAALDVLIEKGVLTDTEIEGKRTAVL